MAELETLHDRVSSYVAMLQPSKRRVLMRELALEVKRLNQERMAGETAPDGSAWEERKAPPRNGKSKAMMAGLRKKLTARASGDKAVVGFPGFAGKIARIHHEGQTAEVSRGGPRIRYALRELIGFADGDLQALEDIILTQG